MGLYNLVPAPDPTYNIGFVTSAIETNLALITASAPAMMPLLRSWFPSLFGGAGGMGRTGAGIRTAVGVGKGGSGDGLGSEPSLPRSSTGILKRHEV